MKEYDTVSEVPAFSEMILIKKPPELCKAQVDRLFTYLFRLTPGKESLSPFYRPIFVTRHMEPIVFTVKWNEREMRPGSIKKARAEHGLY